MICEHAYRCINKQCNHITPHKKTSVCLTFCNRVDKKIKCIPYDELKFELQKTKYEQRRNR